MHPLRQILVTTALALRSLPQRLGPSLVTVIGVATVVAVMVCILAIGQGVRRFVDVNAQEDRAVLLPASGASEFAGAFTTADVAVLQSAPGVKRTADGRAMIQPLAAVGVEVVRRKDGAPQNEMLRGTGEIGNLMNKPTLHMVQGRIFRAGMHELVVGKTAHDLFRGLDVGDTIDIRGAPWRVVGIYADEGGIDENSLAGDVETIKAAFGSTTYQSIGVQLASAADYRRFRDWVMSNPQLNAQVKTLGQYYRDQMKQLRVLFDFVGFFVGGVMAVGAAAGAVTTLYAAVDARVREIATLRAIGFDGGSVVVSIIVEALALAIPGALIGVGLAALAFNGRGVDTAGLAFQASVTPSLALTGVGVALAIGLIGGIFPALRAARLPVAEALRAS
ncbi:MAG TPA: ABC transporter permease [Phenylobacterium sp.]|uniref:ABC transporter permease n=1 Tax=Phenylobacterium sp. TaxID=1871053 RepID=UPI002C0C2654|nr:ABC transporter permease [Phenylobacterium sp.]HSV03079.1 ABC transporter permease [Phenylobacterium sp.]